MDNNFKANLIDNGLWLTAYATALILPPDDARTAVGFGVGLVFGTVLKSSPTKRFFAVAGVGAAGIAMEMFAPAQFYQNTALGLFGSAAYLAGSAVESLRTLDRPAASLNAGPDNG